MVHASVRDGFVQARPGHSIQSECVKNRSEWGVVSNVRSWTLGPHQQYSNPVRRLRKQRPIGPTPKPNHTTHIPWGACPCGLRLATASVSVSDPDPSPGISGNASRTGADRSLDTSRFEGNRGNVCDGARLAIPAQGKSDNEWTSKRSRSYMLSPSRVDRARSPDLVHARMSMSMSTSGPGPVPAGKRMFVLAALASELTRGRSGNARTSGLGVSSAPPGDTNRPEPADDRLLITRLNSGVMGTVQPHLELPTVTRESDLDLASPPSYG